MTDDHPVMRSPAHRMHEALGAAFIEESGWLIPAVYKDGDEGAAIRERVAVGDITARGKIDLRGDIATVVPESVDGAFVARISDDWVLVLAAPEVVEERLRELERVAGGSAMVTDVSHLYAGYALAGPGLPDLLARLTSFDADLLEPGSAAGTTLAEIRTIVVRRDLPVPLVEVYCASELGRYLWETLLRKVRKLGGAPVGWEALRAEGWS